MNFTKNYFQWRFVILLIVLNSLLVALEYGQLTNTLYANGKWIATKTSLEKGLIGAYGFVGVRNTLARGRLDLGAWHGFQEVIYKDAIDIHTAAFNFLLKRNSYVVFIFNKNTEQFSGIRISLNKLFKSTYFTCDSNGKFLTRKDFNVPNLYPEKWNNCRICFTRGRLDIFINNVFIGQYEMELIGGKFFGFRGGEESALIDNILIYSKEPNSIIREFFSNFNISTVLVMMISLVTFSILTLMFSGIKHFHNNHNVSLLNMLITLLLCSIYLADYFVFSTRYPLREYRSLFFNRVLRDRESAYSRNGSFEFIKENNNNYYLQQLNKDTVRIMFIGSSQTWGAGAVKESDTSVKVLEQKINMWLKERGKVQCINYSVSGLDSGALYKIYKSECLKFRPKICVVILSYNDRDEKVFSKNLQNFIDLNRSLNIRTIFVLEANSIEINQGSPPLHKAMRAIGENNGIAVVDLHSFLVENYDQGFLWWDCVHLTNFGQQLAAECLFDALHKEIDIVADKI